MTAGPDPFAGKEWCEELVAVMIIAAFWTAVLRDGLLESAMH